MRNDREADSPATRADRLSRRSLLRRGLVGLALTGSGVATAPAPARSADNVDATISIDNVGARAYEVNNITGTGINIPTGVENPTLTVTEPGTRVRFKNGGFPSHPLEFRDESGTVLLSQSTTGSFADDSAVNWVDDDDTIAFTVTSDLASSLAEYRCTVHVNAMVGGVSVDLPVVDYTPETGSVSFTSPSDGATVTTPVSFEMAAENFTVEAASNGVRDGAGHLHILVDQPAVEPGMVIPNNEPNGYYHYGDGSTTAEISMEAGTHTVRVQAGDAKHRAYDLTDTIQVTVEQSQASGALALSLELPATAQPGNTITLTAELTNRDVPEPSSGSIELTTVPEPLSVAGDTENPVFLGFAGNALPARGESATQQFEINVPEEAAIEQELTLEAEAVVQNDTDERTTTTTQTVTISNQQDPVQRFDTNGDPGIQGNEVLDAISEFNEGGDVEATDVLDVISAFNENSG